MLVPYLFALLVQTPIPEAQPFIDVEFYLFRLIQISWLQFFQFNLFSHNLVMVFPPQKFSNCRVSILLSRWHDSIFSSVILAPMCCRTLQTTFSSWSSAIDEGIDTTSTNSHWEYWAFFQHCLSTNTICLHKMLLTFLMAWWQQRFTRVS